MERRRVVITGLGALSPLGNSAQATWEAMKSGKSGAAPIAHFDASNFKTQFAAEIKDLVVEDHLDRREARRMDRYGHLAMISSEEAIKHSGLRDAGYNPSRVGVIWGGGVGGFQTFQDEMMAFANGNGTPRFNPFFVPKIIPDSPPGLIAMRDGFRGPNFTTVSACASSTNSIIDAINYIRWGYMDACVTGGSEAPVNEAGIGGFNAMNAMSTRNDDPKTASRPFDKDRDGFVLGEGSATFILEEMESAKKRGANIIAEMVGIGLSDDAYHITAPHPEGLGAKEVMENALNDAGMQPEDLDYINVHGTSTPLGDVAELKAIKHVFGDKAYELNISSTKSMTGHLLGGAGALEAFAATMAVVDDVVPPTINHFTDDPEIDSKLNLTFEKAQKRTVNAALSNTFGFGGHNASVIVKKFQ